MSFFNHQIPRFLAHLPEDTDDTSDTENDSGIADETEAETDSSPSADIRSGHQRLHARFPDLRITDSLSVQSDALNNFFQYW